MAKMPSASSSSAANNPRGYQPNQQSSDDERITELSPLDRALESHHPNTGTMSRYLTMTGTITRGRKKGQTVEVQVEVSNDEFDKMNKHGDDSSEDSDNPDCMFGVRKGPHVFLFSVLCMPVALVCSICVTFYYGSATWYNVFIYLFEQKSVWHKIFLCPLVLLSFPLSVALPSVFVGLFAMFAQISWFWKSWTRDFTDFEKGVYGWVCNKLGLTDCCPYEVVEIEDVEPSLPNTAPGRTLATTAL